MAAVLGKVTGNVCFQTVNETLKMGNNTLLLQNITC